MTNDLIDIHENQVCSNKHRYQTEHMAIIGAAMLEGQRIDTCPICNGFHLTRSPKNNPSYYSEMKRDVVNKLNGAQLVEKIEHKAILTMRYLLIKNCKSLDEIVKWNENNPSNKISLKKAVTKFSPEYVNAWNKINPGHL
jgi:hypothetical protein